MSSGIDYRTMKHKCYYNIYIFLSKLVEVYSQVVFLTTVFISVLTSVMEVFFKTKMITKVTIIEVSIAISSLTIPSGIISPKIFEAPQPQTTAKPALAM